MINLTHNTKSKKQAKNKNKNKANNPSQTPVLVRVTVTVMEDSDQSNLEERASLKAYVFTLLFIRCFRKQISLLFRFTNEDPGARCWGENLLAEKAAC